MEQENKILVWAVIILLIAIVSFNFTGMTGEITRNKITTITLDKTHVLPKDAMTLTISPGIKGMDTDVDIYRADTDRRYIQEAVEACRQYKCNDMGTVKYKVSDNFEPGTYYFRLYDLYSKDYVKAYFTVGVLYKSEGPAIHR